MKKIVFIFVVISVFVLLLSPASAAGELPNTSAEAFVLIDAGSGDVLYEKNADKRMLIASTTKIMTAMVVLENCSCDEKVKILPEYTTVEGSSMYLKAGDSLTVRELLYGMMLVSGNDAAAALACHTAGSIENFAKMMNAKVTELGLENTHFANPHGLDAQLNYSTASDLAVIAAAAMKNELFEAVVSTKSMTINGSTYTNHNKLLWMYEYAIGLKTGYTMSAGRSLVSCAQRDGMRFICVTLNDRDDWDDHISLYEWAFNNYKFVEISEIVGYSFEIPVISGIEEQVVAVPEYAAGYLVQDDAAIEYSVYMPKFLYAPIEPGEKVGEIKISGDIEAEIDILVQSGAGLNEESKCTKFEQMLRNALRRIKQIGN